MRVRYAAALLAIVCLVFFEAGCGDTFRPIAIPIVQPGGQPQAQAHAVVVSDAGAGTEGFTTHINVSGDTNVGQVTVGRGPVHAAFVNNNTVTVVANSGSDNLSFYSTFAPTTANPPSSVTLTSGAKPVFVASNVPNTVYVAESGINSVGVVNLSGQPAVVADLPVGANPVAMVGTSDGVRLYVANQGDNTVTAIDTTANLVVPSSAALPNPIAVGTSPVWLVVSQDNSKVFAVNQGSSNVSVINTNTNGVTNVAVGASPNYAFYDVFNNYVWVTNTAGNSVSVINVADLSVSTISVGAGCAPKSVTALADGTRAYVANSGCDTVSVINIPSRTISKTIPVGTTPISIVSSSDSTKVVVANQGSSNVSVIATASDAVEATLPVPATPRFLAITR
ncbi:MAG: 40-residue beta-propeller repeat containing protein [Acidobacteriales bacterium]|nr:40-residue beta-propeller repeat containing protein [Terriglobales bacterium]